MSHQKNGPLQSGKFAFAPNTSIGVLADTVTQNFQHANMPFNAAASGYSHTQQRQSRTGLSASSNPARKELTTEEIREHLSQMKGISDGVKRVVWRMPPSQREDYLRWIIDNENNDNDEVDKFSIPSFDADGSQNGTASIDSIYDISVLNKRAIISKKHSNYGMPDQLQDNSNLSFDFSERGRAGGRGRGVPLNNYSDLSQISNSSVIHGNHRGSHRGRGGYRGRGGRGGVGHDSNRLLGGFECNYGGGGGRGRGRCSHLNNFNKFDKGNSMIICDNTNNNNNNNNNNSELYDDVNDLNKLLEIFEKLKDSNGNVLKHYLFCDENSMVSGYVGGSNALLPFADDTDEIKFAQFCKQMKILRINVIGEHEDEDDDDDDVGNHNNNANENENKDVDEHENPLLGVYHTIRYDHGGTFCSYDLKECFNKMDLYYHDSLINETLKRLGINYGDVINYRTLLKIVQEIGTVSRDASLNNINNHKNHDNGHENGSLDNSGIDIDINAPASSRSASNNSNLFLSINPNSQNDNNNNNNNNNGHFDSDYVMSDNSNGSSHSINSNNAIIVTEEKDDNSNNSVHIDLENRILTHNSSFFSNDTGSSDTNDDNTPSKTVSREEIAFRRNEARRSQRRSINGGNPGGYRVVRGFALGNPAQRKHDSGITPLRGKALPSKLLYDEANAQNYGRPHGAVANAKMFSQAVALGDEVVATTTSNTNGIATENNK